MITHYQYTSIPVIPSLIKLINVIVNKALNFLCADTSLHVILKIHTSEILDSICDPVKLAVDLWSAELVGDPVKEIVLSTLGVSQIQKTSKLLDEVYRNLKVFNKPEILVKFCEVLKRQQNQGLTRVADDIMKQLSSKYIDFSSYTVYSSTKQSQIHII